MAKLYDAIDARNAAFMQAQHVFFVATAPTAANGHLNLSPKGLDCFRILDEQTVAYLDLTGSGIETVAHLRENGRIVVMFCAFDGAPRILRLHGRGVLLAAGTPEYAALRDLFPPYTSARGIIRIVLDRVSDSCGFGVPLYRFEGERSQLTAWADHQGPDGLVAYRDEHNRSSIDGLSGLP
jgi:hypothetical protein